MRGVVLLLMQIYPTHCNVCGQDGFGVILMETMCAGLRYFSKTSCADTWLRQWHPLLLQQFFYTLTLSLQPNTCIQNITVKKGGHLIMEIMEFLSNANPEHSNSTAVFNNTLKQKSVWTGNSWIWIQFLICIFQLFTSFCWDCSHSSVSCQLFPDLKISQLSLSVAREASFWFNGNTLAVVVYCGMTMTGWRKVLDTKLAAILDLQPIVKRVKKIWDLNEGLWVE